MTVTAGVEGVDHLVDVLDAVVRALTDGMPGDAANAGADLLAGIIRQDAPYLSGRLAQSVAGQVVDGGFRVTIGAPYAGYVQADNPWITRDLVATVDDLVRIITSGITDSLARK